MRDAGAVRSGFVMPAPDSPLAYLPQDRRRALARGEALADRARGAALRADVSGFAPLVGALVRAWGPRRGVDEVTRLLDTVYGALIAAAEARAGSVIGFAGDAILCWFDRDDGRRAIACGLAMQAAMRSFREIALPEAAEDPARAERGLAGGPGQRLEPRSVGIAIKAVVAVGPARRFVVGDPADQVLDVLAGALLDRLIAGDRLARRGEVVLASAIPPALAMRATLGERRADPEGRSPVHAQVVTGLSADADAGDDLPGIPDDPHLEPERTRPWLPAPVFARLAAGEGHFMAEIRPAVALFLRFEGIDYEEEPAGARLDAFIRRVQAVLSRFGGCLIQLTAGDQESFLYAAFGAPLAVGDEAERAVAAALALAAPEAAEPGLRLGIGIDAGRMRTGAYGGPTRRAYGVIGDAAIVAHRLMARAAPGQVLVTERIAEATAGLADCRRLGEMRLKGMAAPIAVWAAEAGAPRGSREPREGRAARLVGRDVEMARWGALLADLRAGRGRLLCLEGAAGIGKSRLMARWGEVAAARGCRVVAGGGHRVGAGAPYLAWQPVFRALLEVAARPASGADAPGVEGPGWPDRIPSRHPAWLPRLPLLGDLAGLPIADNAWTAALDPPRRREALTALAGEIVRAAASAAPLVIVLDDAQWLDEASAALAAALGRMIAALPVLIVLGRRPDLGGTPERPEAGGPPWAAGDAPGQAERWLLGELAPGATRALVADSLGAESDDLLAELIQTLAQGQPFFTQALVRAMRESGDIERRPGGDWRLSPGLFDRLQAERCLVRQADGAWRLRPDAPLAPVDLGLPDGVQGAVLARIDRLPDPHKLTLKVASAIGRRFPLGVLAGAHPSRPDAADLARQVEAMAALDLVQRSASDADPGSGPAGGRPRSAPGPAFRFAHHIIQDVVYETLLDGQRRALHQAIGEAIEQERDRSPEPADPALLASLAYHFSRSELGDPATRAKAAGYLAQAAAGARRESAYATALSYYDQALSLVDRRDWREARVDALHVLGRREAERREIAAIEAMDQRPGAPAPAAALLWARYHEATGDYVAAARAVARAQAQAEAAREGLAVLRCLAYRGLIARRQGDYDGARCWYLRALTGIDRWSQADRGGVAALRVEVLGGLGIVYRQRGALGRAGACYRRALRLCRHGGDRLGEADALGNLGVLAFYRRDFEQAERLHQQALELRRVCGDRGGEGESLYSLAQVLRDTGRFGQARARLAEALAIHQATGNRWEEVNLYNELGGLGILVGDLAAARADLGRGLELGRALGDPAGQAYVLANLGIAARLAGDLGEAEARLGAALALFEAQGDPYAVSYCRSHRARVSLENGRWDAAADQAGAALAMRRRIGLERWVGADLATLAAARLGRGEVGPAARLAREALANLDAYAAAGPEFPAHDYFLCGQVLAAAGDAAAGRNAMRRARALLAAHAARIDDPALALAYVEKIALHRRIAARLR